MLVELAPGKARINWIRELSFDKGIQLFRFTIVPKKDLAPSMYQSRIERIILEHSPGMMKQRDQNVSRVPDYKSKRTHRKRQAVILDHSRPRKWHRIIIKTPAGHIPQHAAHPCPAGLRKLVNMNHWKYQRIQLLVRKSSRVERDLGEKDHGPSQAEKPNRV